MGVKLLIISVVTVLGIGFILFLFPGLFVLLMTLVSGAKNQINAQTQTLTSGQNIKIDKKVTPYQDWNTGSARESTEFNLTVHGSVIDSEKLKNLINAKHPETLQFPTVYDVVEMQPDDVLLSVTKDSQGGSYPTVRLHIDPTTQEAVADLLTFDGKESQFNWFPESRIMGWSRVVNTDGHQFLIQHSPFKVVSLGAGDLVKVDFPMAFLAQTARDKNKVYFRAIDLVGGKEVNNLELDGQCFTLPRFSFDYPKVDGQDISESDDDVKFIYGPKWWDKNIDFKNSILQLKTDHVLAAPAPKVLSVTYQPINYNTEAEQSGDAIAASTYGDDEIDSIPLIIKSCAKENPKGYQKAKSLTAIAENISVSEFCLSSGFSIGADIKNKVCGAIARKQMFSKNGVVVNQASFTYHPLKKESKPVAVTSPELEFKGKKYIYLQGQTDYDEIQHLKEFYILNPNQVLFKARGMGPWHLHLVTADEKEQKLQYVGSYAYPGSPFETFEDGQYMYMRRSGGLVRKNPFGYIDFVQGVLTVQAGRAVTFSIFDDEKTLHLSISSFTQTSLMDQNYIWTGKIALECFAKDELPTAQMTVQQREQWFKKYFNWAAGSEQVQLKQSLNGKSNCTLQTVKDK